MFIGCLHDGSAQHAVFFCSSGSTECTKKKRAVKGEGKGREIQWRRVTGDASDINHRRLTIKNILPRAEWLLAGVTGHLRPLYTLCARNNKQRRCVRATAIVLVLRGGPTEHVWPIKGAITRAVNLIDSLSKDDYKFLSVQRTAGRMA